MLNGEDGSSEEKIEGLERELFRENGEEVRTGWVILEFIWFSGGLIVEYWVLVRMFIGVR